LVDAYVQLGQRQTALELLEWAARHDAQRPLWQQRLDELRQ
jgi:hypothetical protein